MTPSPNAAGPAASSADGMDLGEHVIPVLASVLSSLIERNDKLPFNSNQLTIFHALRPPEISIRAYLERMYKYASCSNECFVLALIYIDRILQQNRSFVITSLNVHRLLITSVMLAAKFIDDTYYNNAYYARVGGVGNVEMNSLELEFLFLINFGLHTTPEIFNRYRAELWRHTQTQVGGNPAQHMYPTIVSQAASANDTSGVVANGDQGVASAAGTGGASEAIHHMNVTNPTTTPQPCRPVTGSTHSAPVVHRGFHPPQQSSSTGSAGSGSTAGTSNGGDVGEDGSDAMNVSRQARKIPV